MKVTVRRSGGFANIARTFTIDSEDLDRDAGDDLQRVVEALRSGEGDTAKRPDAYRYRIDVDGEEFTVSESWITEALSRLGKASSRA